jgi:nucleotide-binding universal stress UspA family protein
LFPTSFEEHFRGAFHEAVRLCSILDAKLTVFYKEPYIPYLPLLLKDSPTLYRMIDAKAKERVLEIDRCRAWARDHLVEIEIETDDEPGDVADAISLFAAENNFDLIVMTSETSDFEGPRAGNVCRKVVRTAECPVWTFKPDEMNGNDETAN